MYSRVNYTVVGIFVLLFGIGVVWFGFWLGKYGKSDEYVTYKTFLNQSVSGLSRDSIVMLHGVNVGYVSDISIDREHIWQTRVTLKIQKDIPITEDMVVTTQMMGITGMLGIDIQGGSQDAKLLEANLTTIPILKSKESWFDATKERFLDIADDVKVVTSQIKKLLDDESIGRVKSIIKHTDSISSKLDRELDELNISIVKFNDTLEHIDNNFSMAIDDFHSIKEKMDTISKETLPLLSDIRIATSSFNVSNREFTKSLKRGDYNIKRAIEPTLIDIENLSQQVADLLESINANPNSLLFQSRKLRRGPAE
jgi:phospholipid/cholesterol/gamma-HCH transport system substrate-binding protein